jgi:hypothetical protein
MISESEEEYRPPRNRKTGLRAKNDKKDHSENKEVKIEENECKIEEESISELIEDSIKGKDLTQKK